VAVSPGARSVAAGTAGPPAAATAGAGSKLPVSKVELADVGLEASSLDRTTDPCVDFYQFACGGWIQNNPIPADRPRWSRTGEADERTKVAIQALLDDVARSHASDPQIKKLGDFYASCLDEVAIDRAGTSAIKPLLARTRGVADAASWLTAVIELHKLGIFVVWDHRAAPDLKSSATNITYLDAGGLTLPDRDYYLRPELKDKLAGLERHARRLFELLAPPPSPSSGLDAADVVAIELELARLTRTAVEQRDLAAAYNPTDLAGLAQKARSVDWRAYFRGLGVDPSPRIVLGTPGLFAALDKLRARFKPAQWASYFTFHLLEHFAFALPKPFGGEAFELQKLLSGVEQQRDRTKRCIDLTSDALGDLIGRDYVARYVPDAAKHGATQLVDAIAAAMQAEIAGLDWMSDATKQIASAKLAKLVRMIGYPDHWRSYDYSVRRDDFAGNALRSAAFETHRRLARAGRPVDRGEWRVPAYEVDAYYDPAVNTTALPAGMLQAPFFGQDRTPVVNLGAIGLVIGHELTHGFDDQGAQFDPDGNLRRWWQDDDLAKFTAKGRCVAEQYATFEALPGRYLQGELTLGENIADLGGVKMAFQAYRALRKDAVKTYVADGFTEDQQFFLAAGQAWCGRERPAETERRLTADPHAPAKLRVYGALRNLPAFAEAFHCAAGTPMRPEQPCAVW
jgi:putative endopeptidase